MSSPRPPPQQQPRQRRGAPTFEQVFRDPPPQTGSRSGRRPVPAATGKPVPLPRLMPMRPIEIICPNCGANVVTVTYTEWSNAANITALILFTMGCCLCSLFPYCFTSFRDTHHYCPECHSYLGTHGPCV